MIENFNLNKECFNAKDDNQEARNTADFLKEHFENPTEERTKIIKDKLKEILPDFIYEVDVKIWKKLSKREKIKVIDQWYQEIENVKDTLLKLIFSL